PVHELLGCLEDYPMELVHRFDLDLTRSRPLKESEHEGGRAAGDEELRLHLDEDPGRQGALPLGPVAGDAGRFPLKVAPAIAVVAVDLGVQRCAELRILAGPEECSALAVAPAVVCGHGP